MNYKPLSVILIFGLFFTNAQQKSDISFKEIESEFGQLDIVINAAGMNIQNRDWDDIQQNDWDQVFKVNINGMFYCCKSALQLMKKQNDFIQVRLGGDIDGFANILKNKKINLLSDGRTLRVPYLNEDTFQQIIDAAVESKCQLYEMERSKVTMDNVYLEVIE